MASPRSSAPSVPSAPHIADTSATCPRCDHALRGTTRPVCPECGADASPAALARAARRNAPHRRWLRSALVMLPCIYVPYLWIFLIDHPWDSYRAFWAMRFPVMPAFVPTFLLRALLQPFVDIHPMRDGVQLAVFALITALIVLTSLWLGSRGRRSLIVTAVVVLLLSIACAFGAHGLFWA